MGDLFSMIPFRKCLYSRGCKRPAEFVVSTDPFLVAAGKSVAVASVEVHVCAHHLRLQLKKEHDKGNVLNIDRLA